MSCKMEDLISRQKVINTINVLRTRCDTDDIEDYHDLLVEAMEVLPPSPSRPPWIPCSERLPEEEVLCCDTRGDMIIGYPYQDEESNTGYSAVLDDVVMIDCTAWMPKPKPYQSK